MDFNLTEKEEIFLKQYAEVYEKERALDITSNPIVLVQNQIKHYTSPNYSFDDIEYEVCINDLWTEVVSTINDIRDVVSEYFADSYGDNFELDIENIISEISYNLKHEDTFTMIAHYKNISVTAHYINYDYNTVAYFLTRKEAERYIKYQKHNLYKPRVYTAYSGYSNYGDFEELRVLMLKMGHKLLEEANE